MSNDRASVPPDGAGEMALGDLVNATGVEAKDHIRLRSHKPLLCVSPLQKRVSGTFADASVSHIFIPRRDRFARPDDPVDVVKLENLLQAAGLTLVFMDRVVQPLERGHRRDIGELLVAVLDYNFAGEFRRELAQKILHAQTTLARAGFSIGGRPPFGFRRWLSRADGTPVRSLAAGEYVKMAGHHVVWLPGPEEELALIRRILGTLESMPASRVAATLTEEGLSPPDVGRYRTAHGVRHLTSGVWHQTTITNIARNPLLLAVMSYGRRSMGDQLRFALEGPRGLAEAAPDLVADISAALADFGRLADLAADTSNLGAIGELFHRLNTRLFLRFEEVQPNKRKLNRVAGGVVTFGTSPPPVSLYEGPAGHRALRDMAETPGNTPQLVALSSVPCGTDRQGQLLGKVNRGERI